MGYLNCSTSSRVFPFIHMLVHGLGLMLLMFLLHRPRQWLNNWYALEPRLEYCRYLLVLLLFLCFLSCLRLSRYSHQFLICSCTPPCSIPSTVCGWLSLPSLTLLNYSASSKSAYVLRPPVRPRQDDNQCSRNHRYGERQQSVTRWLKILSWLIHRRV